MLQHIRITAKCKTLLLHARELSTKAQRQANATKRALYADVFPEKMLNKKIKTPDHLYLADAQGANLIYKCLAPFLKKTKCDIAMEINPGPGLLTQKLLAHKGLRRVILIETLEHFLPALHQLQETHPDRLTVKQGDFINLWKLSHQDRMDSGTRLAQLLQDVPKRAHVEDTNVLLFGAVGSYTFFKHLINSLIFQNSLFNFGRCEMYILVPPPIYLHLTCTNEIGYLFYRSNSILFQMLFDYRFIKKVPRDYFLPTQSEFNLSKGSKLGRINSINPDFLYLVKIQPRRNLFDLCPVEDLTALWYFVKQNFVSRRNRIIPSLEKWIPGCGPRLIINSSISEPVQPLYYDEDPLKLPQYSTTCKTMTCRDFYPNMNIYTQFGDLNSSQMLTLFNQFRHWPEYAESSFLASLENTLLKMETAADDNIEEDDDVSEMTSMDNSTSEQLRQLDEPAPTTITKATTTKRKKKTSKFALVS